MKKMFDLTKRLATLKNVRAAHEDVQDLSARQLAGVFGGRGDYSSGGKSDGSGATTCLVGCCVEVDDKKRRLIRF